MNFFSRVQVKAHKMDIVVPYKNPSIYKEIPIKFSGVNMKPEYSDGAMTGRRVAIIVEVSVRKRDVLEY